MHLSHPSFHPRPPGPTEPVLAAAALTSHDVSFTVPVYRSISSPPWRRRAGKQQQQHTQPRAPTPAGATGVSASTPQPSAALLRRHAQLRQCKPAEQQKATTSVCGFSGGVACFHGLAPRDGGAKGADDVCAPTHTSSAPSPFATCGEECVGSTQCGADALGYRPCNKFSHFIPLGLAGFVYYLSPRTKHRCLLISKRDAH